jgi:hypothetical protein
MSTDFDQKFSKRQNNPTREACRNGRQNSLQGGGSYLYLQQILTAAGSRNRRATCCKTSKKYRI